MVKNSLPGHGPTSLMNRPVRIRLWGDVGRVGEKPALTRLNHLSIEDDKQVDLISGHGFESIFFEMFATILRLEILFRNAKALFFVPVITDNFPANIAFTPIFATSFEDILFFMVKKPAVLFPIPALEKNDVSVCPGERQVTPTPKPSSSFDNASEKFST